MKLYSLIYDDLKSLQNFVETRFQPDQHLFIQLFSGSDDCAVLQNILDYLHTRLPQSVVIGATSAGEIHRAQMSQETIVLSFCLLETSRASVYYLDVADRKSAYEIASRAITPLTKVCIAFTEPLKSKENEAFIQALGEAAAHVVVAGGNAADSFAFAQTYLFHADRIEDHGVVLAILEGDSLHVHQDYSFGWTQIGKTMTVTRCKGNDLYELDHQPIETVYRHYLGNDMIRGLPASAIAFPLVSQSENVEVCRSIVGVNKDRSYRFAGEFREGDRVRFAIGNIEEIMEKVETLQQTLCENTIEAMFIYSCAVRKYFLKDQLHYELALLEQIAPTVGFFTYGEFFRGCIANHLLNVTTTILALSESSQNRVPLKKTMLRPATDSVLKFLTHLVNTTQCELDESVNFLRQYKIVLDHSAIFSKMDTQGYITYVNDAFCAATGYTRDEIIGTKHSRFRHPEHDESSYSTLWETIQSQRIWQGVLKCLNRQGETFYIKSTLVPVVNEHGQTMEYITSSTDITEQIVKDRIIQEQLIDELTGLGNRQALFNEIRSDTNEKMLMLINLIGFSEINDYLGYDVGDALLKEIGALLDQRFAEKHRVVFRINGDEFALLIKENDHVWQHKNSDKLYRMIHYLEKHIFLIQGYEIVVRLNVGIASGCDEHIYMQSHIALKEAKKRDEVIVTYNLNETLKDKTKHNIQIIHKIQHAVENDRIVPFYQGIYDNVQKKITKYEVLMRLEEEDGSYLSPYHFLEQAKKTRLYEKLTKIMIQKSFAYLHDKGVAFSLNLNVRDILSVSVKECLYDAIRTYGCGDRVILEIVESEGIDNFEEMSFFIQEAKALGCRIAIDDFGTGYSNFSYLARLKIDYIKIDGSLIQEIDTDPTKEMTVETIVSFAHKMGYKIVAEFVDKETVQAKLERLNVDFSQGYLFSKPHRVIEL